MRKILLIAFVLLSDFIMAQNNLLPRQAPIDRRLKNAEEAIVSAYDSVNTLVDTVFYCLPRERFRATSYSAGGDLGAVLKGDIFYNLETESPKTPLFKKIYPKTEEGLKRIEEYKRKKEQIFNSVICEGFLTKYSPRYDINTKRLNLSFEFREAAQFIPKKNEKYIRNDSYSLTILLPCTEVEAFEVEKCNWCEVRIYYRLSPQDILGYNMNSGYYSNREFIPNLRRKIMNISLWDNDGNLLLLY